jgi:two-component system, chemotaxis family, CheB/CheR fusion protein
MVAPKKDNIKPLANIQNFPIVGVGASAGGLDAFKRLLMAIPENSGMAYVLVQHLDPSHPSFLADILQRVTKIPVKEITDDIHLTPNTIYIIPADKILTTADGVLQLSSRVKNTFKFTIDIFFTSIAKVYKEFAVGIVLSGTGRDGTLGLKAIKELGGITFAQDPKTSEFTNMPQNAIDEGVVDFILPPEKIPEQLIQIKGAYTTSNLFRGSVRAKKSEEEIFNQIILVLENRTGVDFSFYKQPTFHRRIARRIAIVNKNNLSEYLKFLIANPAEQDALFQDVLIPVTSFFRDEKTFQNLSG